ncbi:hypothetical protein [Musicola paradisiaca]|nr:hypothetical protein [Musicola paradisiaca]
MKIKYKTICYVGYSKVVPMEFPVYRKHAGWHALFFIDSAPFGGQVA